MVQIYTAHQDGSVEKLSNNNYFSAKETIEKTTTIANNDSRRSLHGLDVLVSEDGTITKGIDSFIGRKFDDVKSLSYSDVFSVMRNEHQVKELEKSLLLGVNQLPGGSYAVQIDKAKEELEAFINTRIEEYKSQTNKHLDPMYRNK